MMTGKERVMAALRGEESDRVCWSPCVDNYFTSSLAAQGFARVSWADACRLVGADVIERHTPTIRTVEDGTITRRVSKEGDLETEVIESPVGSLTTQRGTNPWEAIHVTRFPIQTIEDVKTWQYVVEHTRYVEDFATFTAHQQYIGEDGIATSSGKFTPLMEFMEDLCGIQGTYYLLADHPQEMQACFARMHEKNKESYRLLVEGPEDVIINYEDTSSTILSPAIFRSYCAPVIDDYAAICHAAGKTYLTHMCGKLSAFGPQLRAGKQDGIESVCPPPTGDIWAHEARAAWGDEKIIFGGLEPPALVRMTVAETHAYVTGVLEAMPTFRRFILGTGDATAHGTPVANLREVSAVVAGFGWK